MVKKIVRKIFGIKFWEGGESKMTINEIINWRQRLDNLWMTGELNTQGYAKFLRLLVKKIKEGKIMSEYLSADERLKCNCRCQDEQEQEDWLRWLDAAEENKEVTDEN